MLLADVVESNHEGAGVYYAEPWLSTRDAAKLRAIARTSPALFSDNQSMGTHRSCSQGPCSNCPNRRSDTRTSKDPSTRPRDQRMSGWDAGRHIRADKILRLGCHMNRQGPSRSHMRRHRPAPGTAVLDRHPTKRRPGPSRRRRHPRMAGWRDPRGHPQPAQHPDPHLARPPRRSCTADSDSARKRNQSAKSCFQSASSAPRPASSR